MTSPQQRNRNFSSDSMGRARVPSDESYYQGMLKAVDGRKGTIVVAVDSKRRLIAICDFCFRMCVTLLGTG